MKILFLPMEGHGHVNSCIGLARMLRDHGHNCVFLVSTNWLNLLSAHSLTLVPLDLEGSDPNKDPQDIWADFIREMSPSFRKTPIEQMKDFHATDFVEFVDNVKKIDDKVASAIPEINPDIIFVDFYVTVPAVVRSGRPWVLLHSANPLFAYDSPKNPPRYSGYGVNDDPKLFKEFRDLVNSEVVKVKADFDEFLINKGLTPHESEFLTHSSYLNVYSYPEDLDYNELGPLPNKWFRLDHVVREAEGGPIGFDESFLKTEQKLIYFSLGSMGSADVSLMNKLIGFFGQSEHRFIISKGPFHEEITLFDNMIGGKYLNQIKILPKVDLVITHGGNNTFIETIYFGKPCIVLPLFGDQHDNARRAIDKRIGKAFGPYQVTKEQLLDGIDEILNDQELIERVRNIGEKIRSTKSHKQLSDRLIEIVAQSKKSPNSTS